MIFIFLHYWFTVFFLFQVPRPGIEPLTPQQPEPWPVTTPDPKLAEPPMNSCCSLFFFFFFFGCAHSMWKFSGPRHSNNSSHCSENARSLACCPTRELLLTFIFIYKMRLLTGTLLDCYSLILHANHLSEHLIHIKYILYITMF